MLLERVQQLDFDDAEAVHEVAEWARKRGLHAYALELYDRVLDADPQHAAAHAQLVDLTARRGIADDAALRKELGEALPGFNLHVTDHFVIVYDTDREAAEERAALLERTHTMFYRTFDRADFLTRPLREKLVVILFADRQDFQTYAAERDAVHHDWSLGHYSARTNRVAFYHEPTGTALARYAERVAVLEAEVREHEEGDRAADRRRAEAELSRLRARHTRLAEATDTARTTHEATHQLAFNAGLLRRGVVHPIWIVEGMATNFEALQSDATFGPRVANPYRRSALVEAVRGDALLPLAELIVQVHSPGDNKAARDLYAQSWALFRYLFRRHPEQLRDYLAALYTFERDRHDPDALHEAFTQAFGELDIFEPRFTAYVRSADP